jgi:hypothetical protein
MLKSARSLLIAVMATSTFFGTSEGWGQSPAGVVTAAAGQPKALFITILDGEGALNDIRARTAREPIVEVDDENHKPVAGALVLFSIDSNGSSTPLADFAGSQTLSVQTGADGRAVGHGFQVTRATGKFDIRVHASVGAAVAEVVIAETNVSSLSHAAAERRVSLLGHKKANWIIASVIAGGVIVGVAIASQQSATTVTPGTGNVGPPPAVAHGIRIPLHLRGH